MPGAWGNSWDEGWLRGRGTNLQEIRVKMVLRILQNVSLLGPRCVHSIRCNRMLMDGLCKQNPNPHSVAHITNLSIPHACRLLTQPHRHAFLCLLLWTHSHSSRTVFALEFPALTPAASGIPSHTFIAALVAGQRAKLSSTRLTTSPLPSALATWRDPVTRRQQIHCDQGPYSRSLPPGQHGNSRGAVPAPARL